MTCSHTRWPSSSRRPRAPASPPRPSKPASRRERSRISGRQTLGDVRWLIDALGAPGDDAPALGVADMDALFEWMQQAGLPVRVQQLGSPGALSPVSELSAHRIVQEALTNALVDGAVERGADVSLDWQDAGLAVTVVSRHW